jgi:hypothetical protein
MPKTLRAERANRPRQATIVVKFVACSRDNAMSAGDDEVNPTPRYNKKPALHV